MKQLILTIDQGTTSSRAIVYDQAGKTICKAQQEINLSFPRPGWVEVDARELWDSVVSVLNTVLSHPEVEPRFIRAIGITNQRETTVIWERETGNPIAAGIVWQSRQTADICNQLRSEGVEELIRAKTGLPIDPYFSATKIRFILDSVPGAQLRAERGELLFGTIDSWLIWKLTGGREHVTDCSNASRTMLFNIHDLTWDEELLRLLNIPAQMLPEVKDSAANFGQTQLHGANIPILAVLGDQQAALFGQKCLNSGTAKATFGTGGFLLMNTGADPILSQTGLLTTIAWRIDNHSTYALEGSFFTAGSAVTWLRDRLRLVDDPGELDQLAQAAATDNGVYFIPALSGLGTPWWNDRARASFMGMTQGTGKEELVRAILEAVVFQAATIVDAMEKESAIELQELKVDGGMVKSDFLMSFLSDILNLEINRPQDFEVTAFGVSVLAGIKGGLWSYEQFFGSSNLIATTFYPQMSSVERQARLSDWRSAVDTICSYY